ncbi:MAG TPA: gamma-glutamyl-gamma-aminobutyrate hydrolase family protein [Gemmatimonadaceae bacterium]|jgi:putative glutamine amidotransferase
MSQPPRIAITASVRADDAGVRRARLNASYLRAIERAGGVPLIIPPLANIAYAEVVIEGSDGLLLTGGEDVDPERYGAPRHPKLEAISPERDATEIALIEAARARAVPTLAICRGLQILNVALGGSLVQDIPSERPSSVDHDPGGARVARVHAIELEPTSQLARALGVTHFTANSFHHQAAARVAVGLRATAWAPDALVEGLEWTGSDGWWAVAAQWHPEELVLGTEPSPDTGLFAEFVRRASSQASLVS